MVKHEHPKGLYVLFGAEAWERFSYYGMRALLVLYMVNHLRFNRQSALAVYALYTGLVYLTPIAGGWFADKILGRRKAVLIGGIVMALGHLAMAFEPLLYLALGLLIVGNGFFKPNISTIVGGLYREGDPRRDGGFTIFYMGINLGAYFSPRICGALGEKVGWHWGFSAAAIGMAAGLAVFTWGQKLLDGIGLPPRKAAAKPVELEPVYRAGKGEEPAPARLSPRDYVDVLVWVMGACALVLSVLKLAPVVAPYWFITPFAAKVVAGAALVALVFYQLYRGSNREEAERITVIIILCLFNIFFWMGFEQAGGTMTLFADQQTNRNLSWGGVGFIALFTIGAGLNLWRSSKGEGARSFWLAITVIFVLNGIVDAVTGARALLREGTYLVPASAFQSINPLLIVALAPSFSKLWERLDSSPRTRTSTPTKMAIGMVVLGLGFVVMFVGQKLAANGPVSPLWLFAVYAIHTVGELCLSPIGLSMVTKLAPTRVVSLAMGLWFVSSFVANLCAGLLEGWLEQWHVPIYGFLVASSIAPALLLLALTPLLEKWMHGRA
jgi:POT family proton-dependent oligopeptide transporter